MRNILCLLVLLGLFGATSRAQDLSELVPPRTWIAQLLPEDLPPLEHPQYATALDRARLESFTGRYRKSLYTLHGMKDADPVEVARIKARSLASLGRRDEALALLTAEAPQTQQLRIEILLELHSTDDALAAAKSLIEKHPHSVAGRYLLGAAMEQAGDLEGAKQAYGWFVVAPQNFLDRWVRDREKAFENAEEVTFICRALDRWAALTGAYRDMPKLHDTLLNMFVRAYDVIDRTFWPAHVAAAEFFLWHDDSKKAKDELKAALQRNPNDARSWDLLAKIAIAEYNFDGADAAIVQIRNVDPDSALADLLEARNMLQQRRAGDALPAIERVLTAQPKNLQAMGLAAASYALQLKDDRAQELIRSIEQIDPDNATAYFEVAERLAAMRQYPRSAAMYKVAVERAPWWTAPRNGLGLLYTQSGEEDLAQAALDAAHALDPFNLATTNYLRLLEDLNKFARKETAHFVILYDPDADPLIADYFAEYLESIYPDIVAAFRHEPSVKTLIEVFPTHDAFSVRTTGSPWIGTVGASTGRVIAMVSPRQGEMTMGPFNWAQVLRHEFTHTVTLSATDNRIPHWMTEGLAVLEEDVPMRWEWVPMLYRAVTHDELFTMENLTWGFVRPKKPTDRSLAYAQSFWVCKYIEETWGRDAILRMLDEFRAGGAQEDVFPKVLGKSLTEFTSDFFAWAKAQVSTWGYDTETSEKYARLRERGEGLVKARQYSDAIAVWEEIASIRPVDALPHQRLAGLYLTKQVNEPLKAIEHLKVLHGVELHDNRYAKRIARAYRDIDQIDDAQQFALQAVYIEPYDLDAHRLLAELYEKSGNNQGLQRERRVIPVLEKWLEDYRRQMQIQPSPQN